MSHTVTASIDKLRVWCAGEWKTYANDSKLINAYIRIHFDQLFLISKDKLLDSINLNEKIKGIYKDDVLILITCNSLQQVRKIKFQVKTNVTECFKALSLHFPVVNYNNSSRSQYQAKYRNIEDVLGNALKKKGSVTGASLPSNISDFMKLCLLDPSFPNVIDQIENVLQKLGN